MQPECTPKDSLIGGLVCCLLLAIALGYYGKKVPVLLVLAACSGLSALSNAATLIQNDKETVCQ